MIDKIRENILTSLPAWEAHKNMAPPIRKPVPNIPNTVRHSAVCILLYYRELRLNTILIKRTEDGKTHSGQIGFPGGKVDDNDFSRTYCALRECEEEIGLSKNLIHILGATSELYIPPSNFIVSPIVCTCDTVEHLVRSEAEVAEIITAPLDELFDAQNKGVKEVWRSDDNSSSMRTPIYQYRQHTIWGATAMMLAELEEIYKRSL